MHTEGDGQEVISTTRAKATRLWVRSVPFFRLLCDITRWTYQVKLLAGTHNGYVGGSRNGNTSQEVWGNTGIHKVPSSQWTYSW